MESGSPELPIPYRSPSSNSRANEEIIERLSQVFELASPSQYRETLLELYYAYIRKEYDALPTNFGAMAE